MLEKKEKKSIQSIEIGFQILEVLLKSSLPLSLTKLSKISGYTPSKLHIYLTTFLKLEIVEQEPSTGHYILGPKAMQLGLGYLDQSSLLDVTKPYMQELSDKLGLTIFLGIWGNKGPTIINRLDGIYSHANFDLRIGSVLPLLSSALGLNYISHLNFNLVELKIIDELKHNPYHPFKNMEEVKKKIVEIKECGISTGRGMILDNFTAISAPIFDFSGNIDAALTIMGSINEFDDNPQGKNAKLLKKAVEQISELRGYKKNVATAECFLFFFVSGFSIDLWSML